MATVRQRPVFLALLLSTWIGLLVACSGENASTAPRAGVVASVIINPRQANLAIGATLQLTTTVRDEVGNVLTDRAVNWRSSAPGVAKVSETGLVTGVSGCLATITAASEGHRDEATITVAAAAPSAALSRFGKQTCG